MKVNEITCLENNTQKIYLKAFPKTSESQHITVMLQEQVSLSSPAENNASLINHSACFLAAQRRVITCGTHFEDTKLVASITGRPVSESMSISWILTPVGTISWKTMKWRRLFLDLIPLKIGGTRVDIWPIQLQCICNQSNLLPSPAGPAFSKHISYNYNVWYPDFDSVIMSVCTATVDYNVAMIKL